MYRDRTTSREILVVMLVSRFMVYIFSVVLRNLGCMEPYQLITLLTSFCSYL